MTAQARVDVLRKLPLLARLLRSQTFRPALMLIALFVFTLAILTGWFGTPAGSRNFGIVFVWIVWWALLIVVLVPFFGRLWCMICPIPAPGEWLQRRGIIRRTQGKPHSLHRRWHRCLKNMWLQNFGFLTVATFSAIILTRPNVSAWVLFGFIVLAVVLSLIYDNRVFCRYVCPVGGFIGLYAMMAPLELRTRDCAACRAHKTKDCVTGNAQGYGCPWMVYPGNLQRNTYCGLCMECLKTCPQNNVTINTRPFGADLFVMKEHRLDEAYKAFIMLACALLYSVVLLGPWGWLKNAANMETIPGWLLYAVAFWAINLLALPGLFLGVTATARFAAKQTAPLRQLFIDYAYALVPLGLAAWIAFSLGFVFANGSYAFAVISDPFGWGWNLFGTAGISWTPMLPGLVSILQMGVLTAGLLFALYVVYRTAEYHSPGRALQATLPLAGLLTAVTLAFLWLYLG
jgi:polyferredoxin